MLVGVGAIVKVHRDRVWESRVDEVRRQLADPNAALVALNANFQGSDHPEVGALRMQIEDQQRLKEVAARNAWLERYSRAQVEARKGDPLVALDKIRNLPQPPHLRLITTPWPLRGDIYESMLQHFDDLLVELGPPVEDNPKQLRQEHQLEEQAREVLAALTEAERSLPEVLSLMQGLDALQKRIQGRYTERDALIDKRLKLENLREQDRLLREAEQHAKNGDFERALAYYKQIMDLDESGEIRDVLQEQHDLLRKQHAAVEAARAFAKQGQHGAAYDELAAIFEDPESFMLPWKVESFPTGARVELDNGRLYTTPFEIETTFGQELVLTVTYGGFEPRRISSSGPSDRFVYLSRVAERSWRGTGRVDAVPVSVEDDHIVVDRQGNLARIGAGGQLRWKQPIQTLSGVARAPVFVPARKGQLLLVTEDGAAWFVDVDTGRLEGPWDLGSPPQVGPVPTGSHVRLRLADKRIALWKDALKPVVEDELGDALGRDGDYLYGSDCGMQVARRRAGHPPSVASRFNDWVVTVESEVFRVHRQGREKELEAYTIVRNGEWEYLAWEAPTSRAPHGRLWISDTEGVRAFEPVR
jgi:tetratricopeptide (TPR) repeat protein